MFVWSKGKIKIQNKVYLVKSRVKFMTSCVVHRFFNQTLGMFSS